MKITVHHYIELKDGEPFNPDDYREFFITNVNGKTYLVEILK